MDLLRLGTRRSLLAWAQSSWVARQIERLNPGVQVELVGIDTRGDKIQNISLQELARAEAAAGTPPGLAKEFFVAELDSALRSGAVDFTVHSLKDLSLDRPAEFCLGAIPQRENPRDVVLFGPRALQHLREGKPLRIGTSSPRRLENLPDFLKQALPRLREDSTIALEFTEIRGNVNTRLARVHEPVTSERYLDAVVLAFAGLIRLWADNKAQQEMKPLLEGVRWMVLPLRECPAAPGQGALAVECRAVSASGTANQAAVAQAEKDAAIRTILAKLHHEPSAQQVALERDVLREAGGGCHQRFGATAINLSPVQPLLLIRGKLPDGRFLNETRWKKPARVQTTTLSAWDGATWRHSATSTAPQRPTSLSPAQAVFVAHSRAAEGVDLSTQRVWTSGTASWFRLARAGVWVEGCAEGLGFEAARTTWQQPVLQLPAPWTVLTHDGNQTGWDAGFTVVPTYSLQDQSYSEEARQALQAATHIYWSSGSQFEHLKDFVSPQAHHACGPGKTLAALQAQGLKPTIFPSVEDWKEWLHS